MKSVPLEIYLELLKIYLFDLWPYNLLLWRLSLKTTLLISLLYYTYFDRYDTITSSTLEDADDSSKWLVVTTDTYCLLKTLIDRRKSWMIRFDAKECWNCKNIKTWHGLKILKTRTGHGLSKLERAFKEDLKNNVKALTLWKNQDWRYEDFSIRRK